MKLPPEKVYHPSTNSYITETVRKAVISDSGRIVTMYVPVEENVELKEKIPDVLNEDVLVFVYGTLKSGHANHDAYLGADKLTGEARSSYVGPAKIKGFLMKHCGGFPAAIESTSDNWIICGEVWRTKRWNMFRGLDRLEGYPHHYNRKEVETEYGKAWIYFQDRKYLKVGDDFVPSGIWLGSQTAAYMFPHNIETDDKIETKFLIESPRNKRLNVRPAEHKVTHFPIVAEKAPTEKKAELPTPTPPVAVKKWDTRADTKNEKPAVVGPIFEEAG